MRGHKNARMQEHEEERMQERKNAGMGGHKDARTREWEDGEDERTYEYNHISTFYYLQYDFIFKYYNKLLSSQGAKKLL